MQSFVKFLPAVLLLAACTVEESVNSQAPKTSEPDASYVQLPHSASVEFDDELTALIEADLSGTATKSASLESVLTGLNIVSLERVFPDAGEFEERSRREGLHRFYNVVFGDDVPMTKAVQTMRSTNGIVSVSPHREIKLRSFNDTYLSRQWHYSNSSYDNADINVKDVWNDYTVGSEEVIVCVVDEPVDPEHEDLVDNLWTDDSGHTGYNFARSSYDLSIRPENGDGDVGHGTHVAGTVGAVSNNGKGVAGIAGGDYANGIPGVRIQSCAIFSGTKSATDSNTARAIKWGADHGAVISQNSWGYYADSDNDGTVSSSELAEFKTWTIDASIKAAIDYFIKYAGCDNDGNQLEDSPMQGGLVFFAAGNENIDYDPICAYEPVIAVGAFRENGTKASYSNYGSWVDIAAPGGAGTRSSNSIWSTLPTGITSSGYGGAGWAGTSMACPHASGVAALIVSYYGCQGFTAERAKEILFGGLGDTIGGSSPIGKKLDAKGAFEFGGIRSGDPLSLGKTDITLHAHETVTLKLTVNAPSSATVTCEPGSSALVYSDGPRSVVITGKDADPGTYKAVFTLKQGGEEDYVLNFEYTILPNHAPTLNLGTYTFTDVIINNTGLTVQKSMPSKLTDFFEDEDGETVTITIGSSDPSVATVSSSALYLNVKSVSYGVARITITGTDGLGESAETSFRVIVKDADKMDIPEMLPEVASTTTSVWPANQETSAMTIKVYSENGALVMSLDTEADIYTPVPLDISSLAPGVYSVVLVYPDGTKANTAFVKY